MELLLCAEVSFIEHVSENWILFSRGRIFLELREAEGRESNRQTEEFSVVELEYQIIMSIDVSAQNIGSYTDIGAQLLLGVATK